MQTSVFQIRSKTEHIVQHYMNYSYLWKDARLDDMVSLLRTHPSITEIEAVRKNYDSLQDQISLFTEFHQIGPIHIRTANMKLGFIIEIKGWKTTLCRLINEKYRAQAIEIHKFIDDCSKDLQINIRNLYDIQFVMSILDRIRDKFYEIDNMIGPIEEAYDYLKRQNYNVPADDTERAASLRNDFQNLLKLVSSTLVFFLIHLR